MRCHPGGRRLRRGTLISPRLRCCTVLASSWRSGFFPATDESNQRPARGVPNHSTDQGSGVTADAYLDPAARLDFGWQAGPRGDRPIRPFAYRIPRAANLSKFRSLDPTDAPGIATSAFASTGHSVALALGSYVPQPDPCTATKQAIYSITSSARC
jgi:hypothetical protein